MADLTPEQRARQQIDTQLAACGWLVQDYHSVDFSAGRGIALREVPLTTGPCDYLLLVDRQGLLFLGLDFDQIISELFANLARDIPPQALVDMRKDFQVHKGFENNIGLLLELEGKISHGDRDLDFNIL